MEWPGITLVLVIAAGIIWLLRAARKRAVKNATDEHAIETLKDAAAVQAANRADDLYYADKPVGSRLADRVRKAKADADRD